MTWIEWGEFFLREYTHGRVSYQSIARFEAQRSILSLSYNQLLIQCAIVPYDHDAEMLVELKAVCDQYGGELSEREQKKFIKAIYALNSLAEKRMQKTAES
jgi:hypothetical protein